MSENRRIFLTGALIAGLLLVTPYYLQLIGIQPEEDTSSSFSEQNTPVLSDISDLPSSQQKKPPVLMQEENKEIALNIKTTTLDLVLTNSGGGAIKQATLLASGEDSYKYLGGFNEEDIYEDSINVSLILNPSSCAPCLSSATNNALFDLPFNLVSVNGKQALNNESFSLLEGDSLVVLMSFVDESTEITKKTVFYGGGYSIQHDFSIASIGPNDFFVSWSGGLRPTEKDRSFEVSQYTMGYIGQEKNIESLSYLPSSLSEESEKKCFLW